jgi:hypothetical protein
LGALLRVELTRDVYDRTHSASARAVEEAERFLAQCFELRWVDLWFLERSLKLLRQQLAIGSQRSRVWNGRRENRFHIAHLLIGRVNLAQDVLDAIANLLFELGIR